MKYWKKNLVFIWICQFLAMVGMSAVVPFLPLYIRELGVTDVNATAQWSGLVFSGPFIISFFLTPLWGNLGDKYGRKILTLRAIFGLALAQIFVGLAQNVTQLFLARLFQGALSGFTPAAMALVAANTPEEKNGYALGIIQMAVSSGTVLGPLIGGFLADLFGYRYVFFIVSGLLFLTGLLFFFFVEELNKVSPSSKKYTLRQNWRFVVSNKTLRITVTAISLAAFGFAFIRPIFVLYFETYNISNTYFVTITGAIYGITGIFAAVSSAWWGKKTEKLGFRRVLIYASFITAMMYFSQVFIYDLFLLVPVRVLLGIGFGGMLPVLFAVMSSRIPGNRKSGILAVGSSFQTLGNILGPALSGTVAGLAGLRFPFVISGIVFVIIMLTVFRKIDF